MTSTHKTDQAARRRAMALVNLEALVGRIYCEEALRPLRDHGAALVWCIREEIAEGKRQVDAMTVSRYARQEDKACQLASDVLLEALKRYPD